MDKYTKEDIGGKDAFGYIIESADKALVVIEKIDSQIAKFSAKIKSISGGVDTNSISGIKELDNAVKSLNIQIDKTAKLEKDKIRLEQLLAKANSEESKAISELAKQEQALSKERLKSISITERENRSIQKLNSTQKKSSLEYIKLTEKQRQLNATIKNIAQFRNAETGSLEQLNAKMKLIETAYNRLTPAQIENTKQGQRYLTSLTNVRAEISKQQQAYGKHNLDVGNYKKAFDGLGFSVTQLAREMPAFANSMQTGFMAISNNLPMFFDEIQKIKQANIELSEAGKPTESVLKKVGGAIFSVQSLLSIGVTLLTVYGAKLVEWGAKFFNVSTNTEKLAKQKKNLNEQLKKGREYVASESAEFVGNIMQLASTNAKSKERSKLISEINEKYGTTLKNISDETKFQAQLNSVVLDYIEYKKQEYKIKQNDQWIEMNLNKQFKKKLELSKSELELKNKIFERDLKYRQALDRGDVDREYSRGIEVLENKIKDLNTSLEEDNKRLFSYGIGINNAKKEIEEFGFKEGDASSKIDKNSKSIQRQVEHLDEINKRQSEMNALLKEFNEIQAEKKLHELEEAYNELKQAEIDFIEQNGIKRLFGTDDIEANLNEEYEIRKDLLKQQEEYEIAQANEKLGDLGEAQRTALRKEYEEKKKTASNIEELDKEYLQRLQELVDEQQSIKSDVLQEEINIKSKFDLEKIKLEKDKNAEIESLNKDFEDALAQSNEKKAEDEKSKVDKQIQNEERLADFRKRMIEESLEQFKQASEEREKLIDKEIDASQKLADSLKEQANNGVITAQQSIAEQNKLTNEKIKEKQKEQKIQQQLDELKLIYSATEQYLSEGDALPVAGGKAFLQVKGIRLLAKNLTGFFSGTERTIGEELGAPQLSGKDGHIVRVDGGEMVLNGGLVNKAKSVDFNATSTEIVNGFIKSRTMEKAPIYVQNTTDKRLIDRIDKLIDITENKTEFSMDANKLTDNLFEFVNTRKKGNDLVIDRYIKRK